MKKLSLLSSIVVFVLLSVGGFPKFAWAGENIKIGYVDVALVFDSYNKTKDQDAALSSKSKEKQQERDKMAENIRNMKNELELLSDKQKEKKQTQIDEEMRKLQDFDQEAKNALRRERDNMVRDILNEIDSVMKDYAQKNGYTMVLNNRVLIYAQKQYDITQEIINILNSKYKKKI